MFFHASWEYGPFISLELDQGWIRPSIWWQYEPVHKADTQTVVTEWSWSIKAYTSFIYCFTLPVDSGKCIQKATSPKNKAGTIFIVITVNPRLMTIMDRFLLQILQIHLSNCFQLNKAGQNLANVHRNQSLCIFLSKVRWTTRRVHPFIFIWNMCAGLRGMSACDREASHKE